MDFKLLMHTKSFTWMSFFSILALSLGPYIAYMFIADNVFVFKVYKTVRQLLVSPHFYLVVFSCLSLSIIYDILVISFIRETETPTYLLYRSIMKNKSLTKDEKRKIFELVTRKELKAEHELNI